MSGKNWVLVTGGAGFIAYHCIERLLRDGVPVASLEAGQVVPLDSDSKDLDSTTERALRIGTLPAVLRPYYA